MGKPLFRLFFSGLCLAITVCLTAALSCVRHRENTPPAAAPQNVAPIPSPCPGPFSHTVKSGETFTSILASFSISPVRAQTFYRALLSSGFTKLYPGDSLILTKGCDSSLAGLSYLSRMQYWYSASLHDSAVIAERTPLKVTVSRTIVNGTLETSLFDAMQTTGLGPLLACRLADIFAWDINFFIDPRKGDTFQIIFEQKFALGRFIGYGEVLAARYKCGTRDYYAIGFPDSAGRLQYYDLTGRSVQKEFLKAPLSFSRISSRFTFRRKHPVLGIVRPHLAIDYAAPTGTPVYAAADGTIMSSGWDKGYGKLVTIAHGGRYSTCYGHLSSIARGIRGGAQVRQGDLIGAVGATGLATGPHLDYRMLSNGRPVNPLTVNLPSKSGINPAEKEAFDRTCVSRTAVFRFRFPATTGYFILTMEQSTVRDTLKKTEQQPLSVSNNGIRPAFQEN
jgi:murein DD-endopeptidase MepM/ murein hydrolase activator NlpD